MLGLNSYPKTGFDFITRHIRGRFTTPQPNNPHIESGNISSLLLSTSVVRHHATVSSPVYTGRAPLDQLYCYQKRNLKIGSPV